jgi:hypothetical protein
MPVRDIPLQQKQKWLKDDEKGADMIRSHFATLPTPTACSMKAWGKHAKRRRPRSDPQKGAP